MPAESYLEHCRDHCTNLVSLRQAIDRKTVAGIWLYCYCHHRATELVTAETEARRLNSENSPLCFTISTPGFIDFLYTTDRSDPILDNCQLTHSKSRIQ